MTTDSNDSTSENRLSHQMIAIRVFLEKNKIFLEVTLIPLLTVLGVILAWIQIRDARRVSEMQVNQRLDDQKDQDADRKTLTAIKDIQTTQTLLLSKENEYLDRSAKLLTATNDLISLLSPAVFYLRQGKADEHGNPSIELGFQKSVTLKALEVWVFERVHGSEGQQTWENPKKRLLDTSTLIPSASSNNPNTQWIKIPYERVGSGIGTEDQPTQIWIGVQYRQSGAGVERFCSMATQLNDTEKHRKLKPGDELDSEMDENPLMKGRFVYPTPTK